MIPAKIKKKAHFQGLSQSNRHSVSRSKKSMMQQIDLYQKDFSLFNTKQQHQTLKHVMKQLSQDSLPQEIPCRDRQKDKIQQFILDALNIGYSPQVLYIAGVPGIGKTLCVNKVITKIQNRPDYDGNKTIFLYQNAMKIKNPQEIFKTILYHLSGTKVNANNACYILNDYFQKGITKGDIKYSPSVNKILVIDQMDYLRTDQNQVIYTIVEWIRNKKSHLSIIGISNTIDLPETFSLKIASRFGNKRIIFPQYTSQQLGIILNQRLKNCQGVFQNDAVIYICKKIGSQQTDIRKCLHILRQSINKYLQGKKLFKKSSKTLVQNIPAFIVEDVVKDLYYDTFIDTFPQFPKAYKIVLIYIAKYFREQRQLLAYSQLENMLGNSVIHSVNQLRSILYDLRDLGLVSIRYMNLKFDNRLDKSFKIPKNVEEEFLSLLVDVDKVMIAKDAEQRQTKTAFDPMDRVRAMNLK